MDINELNKLRATSNLVKIRAAKTRIHFFRNLNFPNLYFIKAWSDICAIDFILKSTHLHPFEDSGYMDLAIEWAFAIECGEFEGYEIEKYLNFIKNSIAKLVSGGNPAEDRWITGNGWYQIDDINNTDKWLNDFFIYQKNQQRDFANPPGKVIQKTLF
jgi:hypothetical protein